MISLAKLAQLALKLACMPTTPALFGRLKVILHERQSNLATVSSSGL